MEEIPLLNRLIRKCDTKVEENELQHRKKYNGIDETINATKVELNKKLDKVLALESKVQYCNSKVATMDSILIATKSALHTEAAQMREGFEQHKSALMETEKKLEEAMKDSMYYIK